MLTQWDIGRLYIYFFFFWMCFGCCCLFVTRRITTYFRLKYRSLLNAYVHLISLHMQMISLRSYVMIEFSHVGRKNLRVLNFAHCASNDWDLRFQCIYFVNIFNWNIDCYFRVDESGLDTFGLSDKSLMIKITIFI